MPKGFNGAPGFGGMNMNNLMKQAQKMQQQMQEMQAELETLTVETTAGGGAVRVVVNGKKQIETLAINPEVVDPEDVEMLEDLIKGAINEALRRIEEQNQQKMSALTGGMGLPGGLF
ncbi:MAG: YbaB/EbfC family nucleoid-associated protein [Clostridiales bacterium]|jgi:DNA-binding YbaB/EbfC family protein|nr:YbaB/EbfC family nucleoid-associated protein [Clostridiales bacterium]